MRSAPAPAENIRGRGASAAFGKAFTIFPASDGGAEHQKSPSLGTGAFFWGGSTSAEGLRAVEKAQLEELAAEAVRGSGATAYWHSHCPPGEAERAEERGAREAAQGRRERPARR